MTVTVFSGGAAAGETLVNSVVSRQVSPHVDSSPTEGSDHVIISSPAGSPTRSERLLQNAAAAAPFVAPFVYRESVTVTVTSR